MSTWLTSGCCGCLLGLWLTALSIVFLKLTALASKQPNAIQIFRLSSLKGLGCVKNEIERKCGIYTQWNSMQP
jgi:hypothetical protein